VPNRNLANMAHTRQSSPDSGFGSQLKVLMIIVQVVPSAPGCGCLALVVTRDRPCRDTSITRTTVQGYLAHKKTPPPLGPPYDPRHDYTVGSYGVAVSYERGTPVGLDRRRANPQVARRSNSIPIQVLGSYVWPASGAYASTRHLRER